jgi:putative ATPase
MYIPLAARVRPQDIDQVIGHTQIREKSGVLSTLLSGHLTSVVLWGPAGCGKTTIAKILAKKYPSVELSAVSASKSDIETLVSRSRLLQQSIVLFLDEIHRFNKAQQDYLLPYVEQGNLILIGATTENPSFSLTSALLSRVKIITLQQLTSDDILHILTRATASEQKSIEPQFLELIARSSDGDARYALTCLEELLAKESVTRELVLAVLQKPLIYDMDGEEHYNCISALIKSMRDSHVQASVYWTSRMIIAGEDPLYICRRMIRFASEDIGLADPKALVYATSARDAVHNLGYPECNTALIQTAIYLAQAPKSNAVYVAAHKAAECIAKTGSLPVPLSMRNAPTKFMKEQGYGKGYQYAHDVAEVHNQNLPAEIENEVFYIPVKK